MDDVGRLSGYFPRPLIPFVSRRELVSTLGVQGREDARNLTSLRARRRSPGDLEQPPGNRRRNNFCVSVPRTTKRRTLAEKKCGGVRCCPGPKKFRSKFPKTVLARSADGWHTAMRNN